MVHVTRHANDHHEYETDPAEYGDAYELMDSLTEDRLAILVALRRGCAAKFIDCEPQSAAALAGRIADLTAEIDDLDPARKPTPGTADAFLARLRTTTAPPTEPSYGDPQATYARASDSDSWRGWGEGRAGP